MRHTDFFGQLMTDTRGATAIEYGLILTLVGVSIAAAMATTGVGTRGQWNNLYETISDRTPVTEPD